MMNFRISISKLLALRVQAPIYSSASSSQYVKGFSYGKIAHRYYSSQGGKQNEEYEKTLESIRQHPQPDSRLLLGYTCNLCKTRSFHSISKLAYSKGIVIVPCKPPCIHKHLIADHLGWFKDWNANGNAPLGTIEDILKQKGEEILTNFDNNAWKSHSNRDAGCIENTKDGVTEVVANENGSFLVHGLSKQDGCS